MVSITEKLRNAQTWINEKFNLATMIVQSENEKNKNVKDYYKEKKRSFKFNDEI